MKTRIVNLRKEKYDVYIGRPSQFGNPFEIGRDGTRSEVIEKYKVWFYERLENPQYKNQVLQLKGKTLGCFCKPSACHGDIIVDYLDKEDKCI